MFATRTVCTPRWRNKEEKEETRGERKERDGDQSSSHGVRSTERRIFFHLFFIPAPPPCSSFFFPRLPSSSKVAACVLFILLSSRPFSAPIVPFSRFPFASHAYPVILLSNPFRSSFRCRSSLGAGAARRGGHAGYGRRKRGAERARWNYGEHKVARLMKSQFSVLSFADSAVDFVRSTRSIRERKILWKIFCV